MERTATMRAGHRPFVGSSVLPTVPFRGLPGPTLLRLPPQCGFSGPRRSWACSALSDGASQGTSAAVNPKLVADKAQLEISENPQGRSGGPGVKGERERVDGSELLTQGSSWEEWLKHFDAMDELAEDAAHYQVELNSAVRTERYGDAARFKKRLGEVAAADTVAAVQRQLQSALAAEQYGEAAELRDRGLVGLAGWWAGKDGPEDFQGHLLHVRPEFGRWTGRIYMARDIAAMNGWRENKMMALLDRADRGGAAAGGASLRGAYESAANGGGGGLGGGTIGTPMMEVFIKQQGAEPAAAVGASGAEQQQQLEPSRLVHQAVALRPPAPKAPKAGAATKEAAGAKGAGAAGASTGVGAGAAALNPASVVRLSIHVAKDGSARISVLPPKLVKSEFSSWEEEEMRATMAALAGDSLGAPSPKKVGSGGGAMSSSKAAASKAASSGSSSVAAPASEEEDDDILTELTRVPAQVAMQGRDRFTFTVLEQDAAGRAGSGSSSSGGASSSASAVAEAGAEAAMASGSSVDLPRWAAVPIDDDDSSGDEAEAAEQRRASSASASSSMTEVPVVEVEVELAPQEEGANDRETARGRAMLEAAASLGMTSDSEDEEDEEDGSELKVSFDMLSAGYGRVDAVATSVTDAEEQRIVIEIPVGRLIRQQQRAAAEAEEAEARRASGAEATSSSSASTSTSTSSKRKGQDTFDRLAERVSQLQAARAGRPVPPEHLATALRQLAQRLVAGELAADGTSAATATVPSPAQAAKAAAAAAKASASRAASGKDASSSSSPQQQLGATRISYSRIPTDLPRSDPFCGLYLGAFGPHGPELIQLSRGLQDGEEVVSAVKVTGDPNVPAGEVSFRAKVGRRHKLDSRDVYPEELGIVARYKGEGRVAMAGYKSPRWVDGELLVFAVGASPVTGGAQLGFVWSVPGEKRFLILLNKLDLKECEK